MEKRFIRHIFIAAAVLLSFSCADGKVKEYGVVKVAEYPHDTKSYTQGLFFHGGTLYESTGQWGSSTLRTVSIPDGRATRRLDFDRKFFVEGSVVFDGQLYVLTWTSRRVFLYDPETLEYKGAKAYPREGWGLTTDGRRLIASDGSSTLYFMDRDLSVRRKVNVTFNGQSVRMLNELEYIDGKIWANVYTTDMIVIIDPSSGVVEGVVDCSGLLPDKLRTDDTDVLNGIAYDPDEGRIYLTGKNWPRLYEVRLEER